MEAVSGMREVGDKEVEEVEAVEKEERPPAGTKAADSALQEVASMA